MKTLVIGASPNPDRYAYKAANLLKTKGHDIYLLGKQKGEVAGAAIEKEWPAQGTIDTVTLYVSAVNQPAIYENILQLKPRRVIFNPGTENPAFEQILQEQGIEPIEACTLVMLTTGQY